MSNSILFNGRSSKEFNIFVNGGGTFDVAERDYSVIEIQGRNGDLIIDNGRYRNVNISYKAFVPSNFQNYIDSIRSWLFSGESNYCRLEDDYDKNCFRLARFLAPLNISTKYKNFSAEFTINFDCKPQRFLKIGEQKKIFSTSGSTIFNPTEFDSKPLITVHGNGNAGNLSVNGNVIRINSWLPTTSGNFVILDSELMDAYNTFGNCNGTISGEFPVLKKGNNEITFTGGITSVEIIPRWWKL